VLLELTGKQNIGLNLAFCALSLFLDSFGDLAQGGRL